MKTPAAAEPWLPDLCRLPRVGAMLGMGQLAVLVVTLVPDGGRDWDVWTFINASGYALWLALTVSVLLCLSRRQLSRLPVRVGAGCAVLVAALVAALVAWVVHGLFSSIAIDRQLPDAARFVSGTASVVALLSALALRYFYVIEHWQKHVRASARAEADALQARIRPHFLFNAMNMIASMVRRDPVLAERAVLDLSDLFRAALGAGEGHSTLADEVRLGERYLAIEQLRLGDRLQVHWDRQEPLPWEMPLPHLILQPLLENAVLHGISRLPAGGAVEIGLSMRPGFLTMRVRNPSLAPDVPGVHGAGHAQRNISHRLAFAYGPRASMVSGWSEGYYACEIVLPVDRGHG